MELVQMKTLSFCLVKIYVWIVQHWIQELVHMTTIFLADKNPSLVDTGFMSS